MSLATLRTPPPAAAGEPAARPPRHRHDGHRVATTLAWVLGVLAALLTVHGIAATVGVITAWSTYSDLTQGLARVALAFYAAAALAAWALMAVALAVRSR